MRGPILAVVLILACLHCCSVLARQSICTFNDRPESLPQTLDSISYLGLNREFHTHGDYYVNFTQASHVMNFTLKEETAFRLYVAPHEEWDIDLYLYDNQSPSWIEHSSLDFFTEEVLQRTLPAGSYRVRFVFLSAALFRPTAGTHECETLTMELALVPKARVLARSSKFTCPEKEQFPSMTITVSEETGYKFNDSSIFNSNTTLPVGDLGKHKYVRFLKSYDFTLPVVKGTPSLWKLEAKLGSDFLVGGSLGILLALNGTKPETNLDCARSLDLSGATLPNCRVGERDLMNEVVLRWVLESDVKHTIWLYDIYGESDRNLSHCMPFTFSLAIEPILPPENLLSCDAPFIPTTLDTPDLLGTRGYLHYKEDVFVDLRNVEHNIQFTLKEKSVFRAFTEEHRVDIDLRLKNGSNTLASSLQFNRRETILMELGPGTYTLNIKYFGSYSVVFCETFFLEIAIAPVRYLPAQFCSATPALREAPDLSGLATGPHSFNVTFGNYRKPIDPKVPRQLIFFKQFETTETSQLRVAVGRDFLIGDLELSLVNSRTSATVLAEHRRNMVVLNIELLPGQYNLTLTTSGLQNSPQVMPDLPSCVAYTFQLNWTVINERKENCWDEISVVESLQTAFFLKPMEVHLTGSYLIPPRAPFGSVLVSQSLDFTVPVTSQIRLYSEPHEIDVDFHIMQGSLSLASATAAANEEEELVLVLETGKTYTFLVQYFNMEMDPYRCSTFDMELAISPVPAPPTCNAASLPADNFIPSPPHPVAGKDIFISTGSYTFFGQDAVFSKRWSFTLDDSYFIRATVTYDFVWSNINVRIISPGQGDEKETDFALGELAYNRNELPLTQLPPGSYILEVYEPLGPPGAIATARCVPFSLTVAFASTRGNVSVAQSNVAYVGCPDYHLPSNLNTLSGLSVFSEQTVHFQRRVLADMEAKSEYVDFSLTAPSVFRIYVPHHPTLDIDVILYPGTAASHPGNAIISRVGFGEESIQKKLAPGNYTVKFLYFGLNHLPLPNPLDCVAYPVEFGITPLSRLEAIPALANACDDSLPPNYIQSALPFNRTFQYKHRKDFNHTMTFNTTQTGRFSFQMRYEFISSGLSLELKGNVRIDEASIVSRSFYGQIGTNLAFLDEVLRPGNYTLTIHDPTSDKDSEITTLPCAPFEMYYLLLAGSTDIPTDYCDESQTVPTDIFTSGGGSTGYGGPQKSDGTVKIYGEKFLMPRQSGTHSYVEFKVPKDSFFRLFSVSPPKSDIDFYVYKDVNRTFTSLANYSNGFDRKESSLFLLKQQTAPYSLDISYFSLDTTKPCNYFTFMMAMKPVSKVYAELACPAILPLSVTNTLTLSADTLTNIHGDYVFTKRQVDVNTVGSKFRYRITLHVLDTTLFFVNIGFDFLANDFHLTISDTNAQKLHSGETKGSTQGGEFSLTNTITAPLAPGNYYLDINEDLMKTDLRLNSTQCHRFSLSMSAFSERTPRVLLVSPDAESAHSHFEDLVVSITFSEAVSSPTGDQLSLLVTNNLWVYLQSYDDDRPHPGEESPPGIRRMSPDSLSFSQRNTVLMAKWYAGGLIMGKTYELRFDLRNFTAASGKHYENAVQKGHFYTIMGDGCNGHGRVNTTITDDTVCICDPPYTGTTCDACMNGFHGAGGNCVPDVRCSVNTCSGHGVCTDANGYPECACDKGYATVGDAFCSICAEGYEGFPKCIAIPDPLDESTRCKATLLPTSLDGIAYLGFDGETRLQGHFFIDPLKREHTTQFTLQEDSAFRIHLSPHWVDVDIALYKSSGGKDKLIGDGGLRMNTEESIYAVLNKTLGDEVYLLKFRYYIFTASVPECETLNMALMISPLASTNARVAANKDVCKATLTSPNKNLPLSGETKITVKSGEDYSYNTGTLFATNGLDGIKWDAPSWFAQGPQGNFFWNITLDLPQPPEGQVMILHAEAGSSFLEDNIVVLLEPGNARNHCSEKASANGPSCIAGRSLYNKNMLNTIVAKGSYTVWLFQPRQPISNCSLFDFTLTVSFRYSFSDTFGCQGARFPGSLNEPNFIDHTGTLHFADDFLLEESFQMVNFTIATESFFKLGVTAELILSFDLFLFNMTTSPATMLKHSSDGYLAEKLPAGSYMFEILVFDQLLGDECPHVNLELVIIPATRVDPTPGSCADGEEVLPNLPATLGSAPYRFNITDSNGMYKPFITYKTGEIASYPITVTETMWLIVDIESDFLTSDVRPEMHIESADASASAPASGYRRAIGRGKRDNQRADHRFGTHEFNLNRLDWILTPGSYALKISRPGQTGPKSPLGPCGRFNFALKLLPMSTDLCEGEELPTSLSTLRFLYSDNNINYQQPAFFVPPGRFPSHLIYLQVKDASLFRVYTEPHAIDIDLKLWKKNDTSDKYDVLVAAGKNGFYDEEVLVALLQEDEAYALEILFWKWNMQNLPACQLFSMGFAITQTAMLPAPEPCPNNGSEHWPPKFPKDMPTKPYYYDSTDPAGVGKAESLYFQQSLTSARSRTYEFSLADITDLYFEVSYNFALGDLVLKLANTITGEVFYGTNEYNRNYLSLLNVVPSNYNLTIYEPPNEDDANIRKCAYFTFRAMVVKGGADNLVDSEAPPLPVSLDGLSYLGYSQGVVHLQGRHSLFVPEVKETHMVTFTLTQPSAFRLSVAPESKASTVSVSLKKQGEKSFLSSGQDIYRSLGSGAYELMFKYTPLAHVADLDDVQAVPLELAIKPARGLGDALKKFTGGPTKCHPLAFNTTRVTINDNSPYYSERNDHTLDAQDINKGRYLQGEISLNLQKETLIYAKLGFNFLFHDMFLQLVGKNVPEDKFPYYGVKGTHTRNLNVLNQLVPAGTYTLRVALQTPISNLWSTLSNFCMPYSLGLFLQEAKANHEHLDCLEYSLLPWNLDNADGGSTPFGGPIVNGAVHISGDKFLLFRDTTNTIVFTVTRKSVLSVYFSQRNTYRTIVSFKLLNRGSDGSSSNLVTPVAANATAGQRVETFVLDPMGGSALFELQLLKDAILLPSGSCYDFGFDMELKPISDVLRDLACKSGQQVTLPEKKLTFNAQHVGVQRVQSVLDYETLTRKSGKFEHSISFQVPEISSLAASLSFSSLSNSLSFSVIRSEFARFPVGKSTLSTVTGRDKTNLVQRLLGTLAPDNYTITISQPALPAPLNPTRGNCYPYIWELQVVPQSVPFVAFVLPEGGEGFDPFKDLVLRVTFSETPYNADGTTVATSDALAKAFKLVDGAESVPAASAEARTEDRSIWGIVFSRGSLKEGKTYTLEIVAGSLTNQKKVSFIYTSIRSFTTLSNACTGHGTPGSSGRCECQVGYSGNKCEKCGVGYIATRPFPDLECVPDDSDVCKPDSCGCLYHNSSGCLPLGECAPIDGKPHCSCKSNYAGDRCETCATGFVSYPLCKVPDECTPHCVHGECDANTKTCKCDPKWKGSADCSKCTEGWSGDNCEVYDKDNSGGSGFVKFLTVVGILLAVFGCLGGVAWVAWYQYKKYNRKKKVNYFPLGLEELEDGLELQASSTFRDSGEDEEDEGAEAPSSYSSSKRTIIKKRKDDNEGTLFSLDGAEKTSTTTTTTSTTTTADDDFNPRARDAKKGGSEDADDHLLNL